MAEKSTIFQTVQIGVETNAGVATPANKKLLATSFDLQPKTQADPFRALGNKFASMVTLNKEWTELALSGKLSYNDIVYLLGSLIAVPAATQQGATTAYKWSFVPDTDGPDAGKTFTIEQGDATTAWKAAGVRVSGLTLTFNRNEVSLAGTAIGAAITTGVTLTAAPTAIAAVPVLPTQGSFYMADTQAGLAGATAMTRGFSLVFGLTDKVGLAWPVGQTAVAVEREPKADARLRLAIDADGVGLLTTMRAGSTKWFRVKYEGGTIQTTYKYSFILDFAAQISELGGFSDEDGIYVAEFGLTPVHDGVWGQAMTIDVINTLTAL